MHIKALDHVALSVADPDRIAELATGRLGMHVIERTEAFTLVGSDARRGKLTLFAAEGPRERGALKHVALRVSDVAHVGVRSTEIDAGEALRLVLVEAATDVEYDLDHVALYARDPEKTAEEYLTLGFERADRREPDIPRVRAGGAFVEFHPGEPDGGDRPLLNHLGLLVDSAGDHLAEAEEIGLEIADVVDAPNTYAVFVWGPERVKIEYVEHKPSFSLA